jgi:glycosyltransferase involved in cell wall biosynthesis
MNTVVSIITPTYNHEKYLADCIQSVLDQDFQQWEMLIVNDGSTDSTAVVADRFAAQDSRIRVFHRKNIGIFRLSETYNFAVSQARGKYIAVLEGDDVWFRDKLSRQVACLEKEPDAVLAWSPASQVNAGGSRVFQESTSSDDSSRVYYDNHPVGSILNILFFRNCIPALTMMIRKNILETIGGFHQDFGLPLVDIPTLQLLATKGTFCYDPKPTGMWRVYPDQVTKSHLVTIFEGCHQLAKRNHADFSKSNELSFQVKEEDLDAWYHRMMVIAHARQGRYCLIRKQFPEARSHYLKAIFGWNGEYVWKMRAITGFIFSILHLDVEGLAKILNRPSYK